MSDTVIRVENLGKKYIIGHQKQERYTALRDVITNKVKSLGSLINPKANNENPAFEEFWALKDVSFDIKQGDRVGIIGRNGAGKSTLLKILSRITEPTQGSIKIKGRVASLLEVGTGFHPELTGRENIFLNGAILGMGKEEIKRKFDEIVAFAEVEKFLDTPVKRYSSGMYVRLAFAVAAHLEPEILIVDEVLAVGDAQFQKKCLGKMEDVGKDGRTILFVSHNMEVIRQLCNYCILLNSGEIQKQDDVNSCITSYLVKSSQGSSIKFEYSEILKEPQFTSIHIVNSNLQYNDRIKVMINLYSRIYEEVAIEIEIRDLQDTPIFYGSTAPMDKNIITIYPNKIISLTLETAPLNLAAGRYKICFWLIKPWQKNFHIFDEGVTFDVEISDPLNTGFSFKQSYRRGCVAMPLAIFDNY
jgi:ABC-type polysaccharide/polyol phosphate transport system ATPase subunit